MSTINIIKMKIIFLLIPIFFFSSCATLILKKDYSTNVSSDVPNEDSHDKTEFRRPKLSKRCYDYWTKDFPTKKGQINLTLSLPWVNSFYLQPKEETAKMNTGFLGISAGLEYFYKDNKYISLTGSGGMDFFLPFPAAVYFHGEIENMFSSYSSLTDNYNLEGFLLGMV